VSYWVGLVLGQGEPPRAPSLSHVKCMSWMGSRFNGHRAHDILGVVVSHSWVPLWRVCGTFICNAFFPGPSFSFYLSFFIFSLAQGEFEGHCPSVVTRWWQCHPQMPNGNEKLGS
jgi:hypothetical protein